jgi:hypothetical protein
VDADQQQRDDAIAAARDQAVRAAVSIGVQVVILIAISAWVKHSDTITLRARQARARFTRTAPGDIGLQQAEWAAEVSAWDHAGRP